MSMLPFKYELCMSPAGASNESAPEFEVLGHTFEILCTRGPLASGHESCSAYVKWRGSLQGLGPPDAEFTISVQSGDGQARAEKAARHRFSSDWGFSAELVQWWTTDQVLRFQATITGISCCLDNQVKLPHASAGEEGSGSEGAAQSRSWDSFLSNSTFSDCVVHLADGTSIPAHRVILSHASSVLAALWTCGTQESQQQQMKMEGEPRVATALLRFCYGVSVELEVRQLPELLTLADMYNVPPLVKMIVDWITTPGLKLDAAALAHTVPALLMVLGSLPEQQQQQVQQHIKAAALETEALSGEEHFLCCWSANDTQTLLKSCTGGAAAAVMAVKAAHQWVQHDAEHRQQHWPQLLQGVDCSSMSAADMEALRADIVDPALILCMFNVLLDRQLKAEKKV